MNILSAENLSKSYSEKVLLNNINLNIDSKEKIGLVGVNGTGKSTLLKILVGVEPYDSGIISKGKDVTIGYLPQNPDFNPTNTVLEQIFQWDTPVMNVIRDYEKTVLDLEKNHDSLTLQKRLTNLSSQMDALDAWKTESEAKTILTKLGIHDFDALVGTLSGGQRKRVAMASALIQQTDLLILDEPTNHIDDNLIQWLEEYLKNRQGALLMITHDRYFLDRVTNNIWELDSGNLYSYTGNYSIYLEKKAEREQEVISKELKRRNLFKTELAWIRTGAKARTTKQKARIDRFEKLKDEAVSLKQEKLEISVGSRRLGKKVIHLDNISKSFGYINAIKNFEYTVLRDDRIGIIGANGQGKSTLLNLIDSRIKVDSGSIDIGDTVKIGYYSQENVDMDESMRVIEYIKDTAEYITTADSSKITASQMLERFLFSKQAQYTRIDRLSGGEKRRLYLLKVLMENPNVLLLDEPTNDLDVQTLTILEEYIQLFQGPVITVSHDRYFLDKITDKLFVFMGDGQIKEFTGNYTQYININENTVGRKELTQKKQKQSKTSENKEKAPKFTYSERLEFEHIDEDIEKLEVEIEEIEKKMNISGCDFVKLQKLSEEKEVLDGKLTSLMERWEYLNEIAEKIEEWNNNKQ